MRRRGFITGLASAAVARPFTARGEQKRIPLIGFLNSTSPGPVAPFVIGFHQGLEKTGYVEGQNLAIEYRWAEGRYDRLPALAADLIGRKVDVIVGIGPGALAAKSQTSTIPIVFLGGGDVLGTEAIDSIARPGGNVTGISIMTTELDPKRLDLLSDLLPEARVIALLTNPTRANAESMTRDVQEAARTKGVQLPVLKAATEGEIGTAFGALVQLHAGALVIAADPFFTSKRDQLVALAARFGIPAIYQWREFVVAGGLVSYGSSLLGLYRQAGVYVGKILNGTRPAELPIDQPAIFELVINLKTAKALGLTVPQSILARADEVIE